MEHIQFSTSRRNANIVRSNVWTSLPRLQILFLLAFQTTMLLLPNTIRAYKFCLILLSLCAASPSPSSILLKLLFAPSLSLSPSMAKTNAAVNQKKIDDCYMPRVRSNGSFINTTDDSLSGVDDPVRLNFYQSSCWLYSVPNLHVFQQVVTLYLGGILVRVVSEIV